MPSIEDLESALGAIIQMEVREMGMGAEVQLIHVLGVLESAKQIASDALSAAPKAPAAPIRDPVDGIREAYDAGFDAGIKGVYDSDRGASK